MTFLEYGVLKNVWLWSHLLLGGFLAKIILLIGADGQRATVWVLVVAVAYEIVMYFYRSSNGSLESIYGDEQEGVSAKEHYLMDAFFDVIGALLMAIIVAI